MAAAQWVALSCITYGDMSLMTRRSEVNGLTFLVYHAVSTKAGRSGFSVDSGDMYVLSIPSGMGSQPAMGAFLASGLAIYIGELSSAT